MTAPDGGPPDRRYPGSPVLWRLAVLGTSIFYRIDRVGPPLPEGPVLLVANHPNTVLDPAVIQGTATRPVRFLAKSTLFERHVLSPFVRRSGAIPVYRRIDPGVDTARNVETFAAVERALAEGDAICLFPEGVSHVSGRLEPLRTGAARMALAAAAAGRRVAIVPVGLNFDRLPMFRSRMTALYGRPFDPGDLVDAFRADPHRATRILTDRIAARLRRVMIEADPRADLPLVDRVDRLYAAARGVSRDPAERVRRRRLIARGMDRLREEHPDRYDAILGDVLAHDEQLRALGLREQDLDRRMPAGRVLRFVLREGGRALVTGPLAALALVCFAVPYYATWALSAKAPDPQSRAAWEVVGGAVVYGAWIAALSVASGLWFGGGIGAATAAGLVGLAFTGLSAIERQAAVVRLVRAFLATRQTPLRARARLKRQRAAIAAVLERVHGWLSAQGPGAGPVAPAPDGPAPRPDPGQEPGTELPASAPAPDGPRPRADTDAGREGTAGPPVTPPASADPEPRANTVDGPRPRADTDAGREGTAEPPVTPPASAGPAPRANAVPGREADTGPHGPGGPELAPDGQEPPAGTPPDPRAEGG